jgi:hypothetical protein
MTMCKTICKKTCATVFALMVMASSTALAQTHAQSPNTSGCTPQERSAQNLSQSNGVICPPDVVDPGGVKAPPTAGSMPVIPPPGSPGGNPDVQPK